MAVYPLEPRPSSVSAPAYIDPTLRFATESGYETRRSLHSRPRRQYQLDYQGKTTEELRIIADFLQTVRYGVREPFEFFHPTAAELIPGTNTTPIWLIYYHATFTGQYVYVDAPAVITGIWRVTRVHSNALALDGSVAQGNLQVQMRAYLPTAIARLEGDTSPAAEKIVGTDRTGPDRPGAPLGALAGRFSFGVVIEEVF